jgi:hypothetical protein
VILIDRAPFFYGTGERPVPALWGFSLTPIVPHHTSIPFPCLPADPGPVTTPLGTPYRRTRSIKCSPKMVFSPKMVLCHMLIFTQLQLVCTVIPGFQRKHMPQELPQQWLDRDVSCCAWSMKYRFVYVKTAKTGGSSIMLGVLRNTLCLAKQNSTRIALSFTGGLSLDMDCDRHLLYPTPGEADCEDCRHVEPWMWNDFFVFGAARNTWERAVSSYKYCQVSQMNISWLDWCSQPDIASDCFARLGPPKRNIHWASQSKAFFWRNYTRVDFLFDTQYLKSMFHVLENRLNARNHVRIYFNLSYVKLNALQDHARLKQWYAGEKSACIRAIANVYSEDLYHFGSFGGRPWSLKRLSRQRNSSAVLYP